MTQNNVKRIRPLPAGSHLVEIKKGVNKGKFAVYGLEGLQNSLMRFANTSLFVVVENCSENSGSVYETREEAERWANDPRFQRKYYVKEIVLKQSQIVR